jgi:hypothetical protein
MTPTGYNGTFTVTAATDRTVSYASTATGAMTVAGTIASGGIVRVTGNANIGNVGTTHIVASGNINAANVILTGNLQTANLVASTGNITGTFTATLFSGNGASLANVNGANITGIVANASYAATAAAATVAASANSVSGANVSGNVGNALYAYGVSGSNVTGAVTLASLATTLSAGTHANITGVGTLGNLTVTANIGAGNISAANVTANHYGNYSGNGASLTNLSATAISGKVANATYADSAGSAGAVAWLSITGRPSFQTVATSGSYNDLADKPTIPPAYSPPQGIGTSAQFQVSTLGVGATPSTTNGEIRASNNITAYYSDERLKTKLGGIENALDMIDQLSGFYYEANDLAQSLGYDKKREIGVSAQETKRVLPEIVAPAPIDEKYMTVRYEKFAPLLIEGIKALRREVNELRTMIEGKK